MAIIANNDTFEKIRTVIGIDGDELDLQPPHPSVSAALAAGLPDLPQSAANAHRRQSDTKRTLHTATFMRNE